VTTISAKIIADSISPDGIRITTFHLRYPRFIHAELMTHRVFSRNARSSRAVPVGKMIEEIQNDPVIPIHWGKNQAGMQAHEEHDAPVTIGLDFDLSKTLTRMQAWLFARDRAVEAAQAFHAAGYHKQVVNRLLEPFMHIDTLVTATEWSNWYALRDHKDAEPHIKKLAEEMKKARDASTPEKLEPGAWHLPYVDEATEDQVADYVIGTGGAGPREVQMISDLLIKLSVARSARISYAPFDGDGSIEKELDRYEKLVGSYPMHASPAEHQATPDRKRSAGISDWTQGWWQEELHGNFVGWIQFRKTLQGECQ
jgi:hypothetical protein